jgi:hypothetical protein
MNDRFKSFGLATSTPPICGGLPLSSHACFPRGAAEPDPCSPFTRTTKENVHVVHR